MKWAQGFYKIRHPEKYIGTNRPRFRSSWEHTFMKFCDEHPSVIKWASEPMRIPYINPATSKKTTYVPDFLIIYENKNKEQICELIEIKPSNQTPFWLKKKSTANKIHTIINEAKWKAATAWANANNIKFRILTEHDLFKKTKK
jgi:hypothetical protein